MSGGEREGGPGESATARDLYEMLCADACDLRTAAYRFGAKDIPRHALEAQANLCDVGSSIVLALVELREELERHRT